MRLPIEKSANGRFILNGRGWEIEMFARYGDVPRSPDHEEIEMEGCHEDEPFQHAVLHVLVGITRQNDPNYQAPEYDPQLGCGVIDILPFGSYLPAQIKVA